MPDCSSIDPLVTAYVDGELPAPDARTVDAHLRHCAPCRARVTAEASIRDLIRARKSALCQAAPGALRGKCAGLAKTRTVPAWRARLVPVALAATLVLIVGGAFLYRMTQLSTRVMAAELTADHVKCFLVNGVLRTAQSQAAVESSLAAGFGWDAHLPERPEEAGLELVGARPCLYGEGRVAHIMYRHNGDPVSVFMLPDTHRPDELVGVWGHEAAIRSRGERTFVIVARKPRAEVEQIASFVHATLR